MKNLKSAIFLTFLLIKIHNQLYNNVIKNLKSAIFSTFLIIKNYMISQQPYATFYFSRTMKKRQTSRQSENTTYFLLYGEVLSSLVLFRFFLSESVSEKIKSSVVCF